MKPATIAFTASTLLFVSVSAHAVPEEGSYTRPAAIREQKGSDDDDDGDKTSSTTSNTHWLASHHR